MLLVAGRQRHRHLQQRLRPGHALVAGHLDGLRLRDRLGEAHLGVVPLYLIELEGNHLVVGVQEAGRDQHQGHAGAHAERRVQGATLCPKEVAQGQA